MKSRSYFLIVVGVALFAQAALANGLEDGFTKHLWRLDQNASNVGKCPVTLLFEAGGGIISENTFFINESLPGNDGVANWQYSWELGTQATDQNGVLTIQNYNADHYWGTATYSLIAGASRSASLTEVVVENGNETSLKCTFKQDSNF